MDTDSYDTRMAVSPSQREARELDRIEQAADRMVLVADRLGGFLSRFHGGQPVPEAGRASVSPVPAGYRGQMDRLYDHLNMIENHVQELVSLG